MILAAATYIFFDKRAVFQIIMNNALVTAMIAYLCHDRLYHNKKYFRFQVFNEVSIWFCLYHMICFNDFVKDRAMMNMLGYSAVVTLTLNLVINFSSILKDLVVDSYKKLRLKYFTNKRLNLIKKLQQDRERRQTEAKFELQAPIKQSTTAKATGYKAVDYNQQIQIKKKRQQDLTPSIVFQSIDESQMDGIFKGEVNLSIDEMAKSDSSDIFAYDNMRRVAGI